MDQLKDKNFLIYILGSFVIGLLVGTSLVLLFFPDKECICDIQQTVYEGESDEKEIKIITNQETEEINENVSLPVSGCNIVVDISGAVKAPGVYCFKHGSRIIDVVNKANGFLSGVANKYVSMRMNLALPITDSQKIYIPFEEDVYCEIKNVEYINEQKAPSNNTNQSSTPTNSCININSASKEELTKLTGVGDATAEKIIEHRPYNTVLDILKVPGIGEATYEKLKDDICV